MRGFWTPGALVPPAPGEHALLMTAWGRVADIAGAGEQRVLAALMEKAVGSSNACGQELTDCRQAFHVTWKCDEKAGGHPPRRAGSDSSTRGRGAAASTSFHWPGR